MPDTRNDRIVLARRPSGMPTADDFRLEQVACPEIGPGQVLLRTQFLSLDPYMRGRMSAAKSYAAPVAVGAVMEGEVVAVVEDSQHPAHTAGDVVVAPSGWQRYAALDGADLRKLDPDAAPVSTALGVLGMPGFTAYAGLRQIGRPQAGETVVVAAATGPVGSAVGQIARIGGARAVGIAGGPEKCAALRDVFGFDAALDHRAPDFPQALAAACPNGIDVYFENVGGAVWDAVFPLLNPFSRIPVCGLVAHYNADTGAPLPGPDRLPGLMRQVLSRRLHIQGFIQSDYKELRPEFYRDMAGWIGDGRVQYREDVVEGLAAAPEAFIGLLTGRNFGKLLVRFTD